MAIDSRYVWPWIVQMVSGKLHSTSDYRVTCLYTQEQLPSHERERMLRAATMVELELSFEAIVPLPEWRGVRHVSAISSARLHLADSRSTPFVWLDSDLCLLPGWSELMEPRHHPQAGYVISAAADPLSLGETHVSPNTALRLAARNYFNAGVMVVDPTRWRAEGLDDRVKEGLLFYDELHFEWADQCILNYATRGEHSPLPEDLNFMISQTRSLPAAFPRILHFAGSWKPWRARSWLVASRQEPLLRERVDLSRAIWRYSEDMALQALGVFRSGRNLSRRHWALRQAVAEFEAVKVKLRSIQKRSPLSHHPSTADPTAE